MSTVDLDVGLSLSDGYRDGTSVSSDGLTVSMTGGPNTVGYFYHKTDAGDRSAKWLHTLFVLPANIPAGSQGLVTVQYVVSNTDHDIQTTDGRAAVDLALSGVTPVEQAEMRTRAPDVGRYRYMKFLMDTGPSAGTPTLHEFGRTETVRLPVRYTQTFVISVNEPQKSTPPTLRFTQNGKGIATFCFLRNADTEPVDLTAATITFTLAKSMKAPPVSAALTDKVVELDTDPTTGVARLTLSATDLNIESGTYLGAVTYDDGGDTKFNTFVPVYIDKDL